MAGSVNKAIILGNLGKDPVIRTTQSGQKIATLSIATSESWKNKQTGERQERTTWHTVVIFNEGLAGVAEKYLRKGAKVYVEGSLQTRKWQDQQGQDRYVTEIVLQAFNGTLTIIDSPKSESQQIADRMADEPARGNGGGFGGAGSKPFDEDIPFSAEVR